MTIWESIKQMFERGETGVRYHIEAEQERVRQLAREEEQMRDYQRRTALIAEFGEERGRGIWEQEKKMIR